MESRSIGRILVFTFLLLAWSPSANSQLLSFGVKGGVPLTDPLDTRQGGSGSVAHDVRRYIVGPTGELHLPVGLSVEVDALYRPLNYTIYPVNLPATAYTGSDWQIPLLGKYEFHKGIIVHPFVDGGVTYRHVKFPNVPLANANTAGVSIGGGLIFRLLFVRLSSEFRYTHFPAEVFGNNFNFIHSTSNQADFLVGLTF